MNPMINRAFFWTSVILLAVAIGNFFNESESALAISTFVIAATLLHIGLRFMLNELYRDR